MTVEGKWIQKTIIPVEKFDRRNQFSFSGCVLKLSEGLLNKLKVIGE